MKLETIKNHLRRLDKIAFLLPDGSEVPAHFHVTEVGKIHKHFIDCGGTVRQEEVVNFQLWNADDYDHRLHPEKLLHIIELSQEKLAIGNLDIEVEYQGETIGKYGLDIEKNVFRLVTKETDCLAKSNCGIPVEKEAINLEALPTSSCCAPDSNCC